MEWNYAELSKEAKKVGGPEKLIEQLIQQGRNEMIPWIAGTGVLCLGIGIGVNKAIEFFKNKKRSSEQTIELVKKELIDGTNQFDSEHVDDIKEG